MNNLMQAAFGIDAASRKLVRRICALEDALKILIQQRSEHAQQADVILGLISELELEYKKHRDCSMLLYKRELHKSSPVSPGRYTWRLRILDWSSEPSRWYSIAERLVCIYRIDEIVTDINILPGGCFAVDLYGTSSSDFIDELFTNSSIIDQPCSALRAIDYQRIP